MIKIIIGICIFLLGLGLGYIFGWHDLQSRSTAGTCFRMEDGEVYLKLSEIAQQQLADPETARLVLQVIDTRNKQPL